MENNPNNPNNQSKIEFYKHIKYFARAGLIIGCLYAIIILTNSFLDGDLSYEIGTMVFDGVIGTLFVALFVPLSMMLTWIPLGVVSFMITMLGKWVMRI